MELSLNFHGNEKQLEAAGYWIDNETEEIGYGGGKGGGKTYLGVGLTFGDALIYPNTHYFIARKRLVDLRRYTIPSVYEVFEHWGLDTSKYFRYNGNDNYFHLYNDSKVFLIDAKYIPSDPMYHRFGSMQMTRGMIEEAGEFEFAAKSALGASIGRWKNDIYNLKGKLLMTCNPTKNFLYQDFYKKHKEGILEPSKKFVIALPHNNKRLPAGYVDRLINTLSPSEVERLVYGNWEYDDDPMRMMEYEKILELFTNTFVEPTGQRYITADIAYEGSDLFVIGVWDGFVLQHIVAFDKCDETQVSKRIEDIRNQYKVPLGNVAYDADGLKRFVRESSKTGLLAGARQFHNGGKPIGKEFYQNLKSQCYFMLAEKVASNEIYISAKDYRKQIIEELEQIKKNHRSDDIRKLSVESKDDIRKRLNGRSPDFADMIMMRMVFELREPKSYKTDASVIRNINY